MKPIFAACGCLYVSLFLIGCSKTDQERAREKATEAQQKSRTEAEKLGREAKEGARNLNRRIDSALKGRPAAVQDAGNQAGEKLDHATQVAKTEGERATRKLSRAAMIAKVKGRLVSDVGLSTASNVEVGVVGGTVTLAGTVSSEEQKTQAERSVSQIDGVEKVINRLTVQ